jgi:hypothetical protein
LNQCTELGIDVTTIEMFGPELEIGVELIERLPEGLWIPDDLADRRLLIGLQQAVEHRSHHGHRLQRDMVVIDRLQIGPGTTTVLGRGGACATRADGIDTTGLERHDRFEAEITDPVIDAVVHVAEALPLMEAQHCQRDVARITINVRTIQPWRAIRLAMDVK